MNRRDFLKFSSFTAVASVPVSIAAAKIKYGKHNKHIKPELIYNDPCNAPVIDVDNIDNCGITIITTGDYICFCRKIKDEKCVKSGLIYACRLHPVIGVSFISQLVDVIFSLDSRMRERLTSSTELKKMYDKFGTAISRAV